MQENRGFERPAAVHGLTAGFRKFGLETPISGRFSNEMRRLTFAPPLWYDALVLACIFGGGLLALAAILPLDLVSPVALFVGPAVALAGLWAGSCNERLICDLQQRTYARLEGQAFRFRMQRGALSELDALVLMTELYPVGSVVGARTVVYRLVLYWKGQARPLLVVEQEVSTIGSTAPLNQNAGRLLQHGAAYAQALGVPFFDNSYYVSPQPLKVL